MYDYTTVGKQEDVFFFICNTDIYLTHHHGLLFLEREKDTRSEFSLQNEEKTSLNTIVVSQRFKIRKKTEVFFECHARTSHNLKELHGRFFR